MTNSPHKEICCAECFEMTIDQYQVDDRILCSSCFEIYADSVSQTKVRAKAIVEKPVKKPTEIEVTVAEPLESKIIVEQVAEEPPQETVEEPRPEPKKKAPPRESVMLLKREIKRRAARNTILHDSIERIQILFAIPKDTPIDETLSILKDHKQRFNQMNDDVALERQRRLS